MKKTKTVPPEIAAAASALASLRMVRLSAARRRQIASMGGQALKAKRAAERAAS